jgi:hypothetical protein
MDKENENSEKELEKDWEEALKKDKKAEEKNPADLILDKEAEKVLEKKSKSKKKNELLLKKTNKNLKRETEKNPVKKEKLNKDSTEEVKIKINTGKKADNEPEKKPKEKAVEKPGSKKVVEKIENKVGDKGKLKDKKEDEKKKVASSVTRLASPVRLNSMKQAGRHGGGEKEARKGDIKKNICKNVAECLSFSQRNSWVFTILFFIIILVASIWIWQKCIQNPLPDEEVIVRFKQSQDEKKEKSEKIEKVIKKLQERKENFMNLPNLENQREVFKNKDELDYLNTSGGQSLETTNIQ